MSFKETRTMKDWCLEDLSITRRCYLSRPLWMECLATDKKTKESRVLHRNLAVIVV